MTPFVIDDVPAAIRAAKQSLRAGLPRYRDVFAQVEADIARQVEVIVAARENGGVVIPEIRYADVAAGAVSQDAIDLVEAAGRCAAGAVAYRDARISEQALEGAQRRPATFRSRARAGLCGPATAASSRLRIARPVRPL
jgi:hypothetical protein